MKLALNGALTIGTLDGANVEIREEVGDGELLPLRPDRGRGGGQARGGLRNPIDDVAHDGELAAVLELIGSGFFSPAEPRLFQPILDSLIARGPLLRARRLRRLHGLPGARRRAPISDQTSWQRAAVLNIARMGKFSSDRTIREYAEDIWNADAGEGGAHALPALSSSRNAAATKSTSPSSSDW